MTSVIFVLVTHKYSTAVKSHIQACFINTTTTLPIAIQPKALSLLGGKSPT